jgi:hypothetical protein
MRDSIAFSKPMPRIIQAKRPIKETVTSAHLFIDAQHASDDKTRLTSVAKTIGPYSEII